MTSNNGFRGTLGDFVRAITSVGGVLAFFGAATLAIWFGGRRNGGKRRSAHAKPAEPRARKRAGLFGLAESAEVADPWINGPDSGRLADRQPAPWDDDFPAWVRNQSRPSQSGFPAVPADGRGTAARRELPPAQPRGPRHRASSRLEPIIRTRIQPGSEKPSTRLNPGAGAAPFPGPFSAPAGQHAYPSGSLTRYDPPSAATPLYDQLAGPMPGHGHPSGPMPRYDPLQTGPVRQYDHPSGPLPRYDPLAAFMSQDGDLYGAITRYDPPSGSLPPYGPALGAEPPYGHPSGPLPRYDPPQP